MPNKVTKRPTQADVARLAGVSRGTVSLILNDSAHRVPFSSATRERVLAAALELAYSPNPVAQMLVRGKNRIIGFLSLEDDFPYNPADFYHPYLVGIEREAGALEYNLLLFTSDQSSSPRRVFRRGMNTLRLADGVIMAGNYPDPSELHRLAKEQFPFVLIGRSTIPNDQVDTVVNDHTPTSYEATRHLIDYGHERIGFIVDDLSLAYHQERYAGCEKATSGVPNVDLALISHDDLTSSERFRSILQEHGLTALICADRKLVAQTLQCIRGLAMRVPDDISLLFLVSNTSALPYRNPTRVNINPDRKGRAAVRRLVERLEDRTAGYTQIKVECQFVPGETTAPPKM